MDPLWARWEERRQICSAVIEEALQMIIQEEEELEEKHNEPITRRSISRDRQVSHARLVEHYFSENPVYLEEMFRRRFRMSKRLFELIVQDLGGRYDYFKWLSDGRGRQGLSPLQKCTAAIRQLAYGIASDMMDEYVQLGDKTARYCLNHFYVGIIQIYGRYHLRSPTYDDMQRLYHTHNTRHGLPGMIGSLDCTHWDWQNCPVAWQGQFTRGDHGRPTVILQAVASQDLWFWHAFFGVAGSNNDINVLNQSSILTEQAEGIVPSVPFTVNGVQYRTGYYLCDGIYPDWAIFVNSPTCPTDDKRKKFKKAQEFARKDIERAFGVLKQRWHILHYPAHSKSKERLRNIMYACLVLHNMILEDEGNVISIIPQDAVLPGDEDPDITAEERDANVTHIIDPINHNNLRHDLTEHIWPIDLPHRDN